MQKRKDWRSILRFDIAANRSSVAAAFVAYRAELGIPRRCDVPTCPFHAAPLEWNGAPLPLILDHEDGNRFDQSPGNLRYLCPACDSQQETKGGRNRGRLKNVTAN